MILESVGDLISLSLPKELMGPSRVGLLLFLSAPALDIKLYD